MTHDLVVAGGHVLCPATGADGIADVAIDDGRIAVVGEGLTGRERVDAGGLLVVPGLIDLHVHVYDGVSHYGVDADTLSAPPRHDDGRRRGIGRARRRFPACAGWSSSRRRRASTPISTSPWRA